MREITIYHPDMKVNELLSALCETYNVKGVSKGSLDPPTSVYEKSRDQYNAQELLEYLFTYDIPALWILEEDLFTSGMNFIFGMAVKNKGAVVSTHRLPNREMIVKETMHEIGHVMGLSHCSNTCVMQFSNSLQEALEKPSRLCTVCSQRIRKRT